MSDIPFLKPKKIKILDMDKREREFVISRFPAIEGRAICTQYPMTNLPKLGEYRASQEVMLKLMAYVGVEVGEEGKPKVLLPLNAWDLINNHVGDWETLGRIEIEMLQYNCSFFSPEKVLNFLDLISRRIPELASKILTDSLAQSSNPAKPPSEN